MAYKLTSTDGMHSFELRDGAAHVVGRAPTSDIPVIDPTISRRHAELECRDGIVTVRDLGSSNGTFLNGTRVETATVNVGDTVTFGKVGFKLQQLAPAAPAAAPTAQQAAPPGATIVRQLPVRDPSATIAGIQSPLTAPTTPSSQQALVGGVMPPIDKNRQKLATLLEVSKGLG